MKFTGFLSSFISIPFLVFSLTAQAKLADKGIRLPEVVVTANRLSTPLDEVASSATVIEVNQSVLADYQSVSDVLREKSGIEIFNQGGFGKVSNVFIRGANSEHTLVLLDGMEVNDPMSPTRAFDFARLDLSNVERIEVIKGPQSVLYGSDALGGVINIITHKGSGKPKSKIELEGGAYDYYRASLATSGGLKKWNYSFAVAQQEAEGFSSASQKDGNTETDGHQQISLSQRVGVQISEQTDLEFSAKYINANSDLDAFGGPGGDDPDFRDETEQIFAHLQARHFSLHSRLETLAGVHLNYNDRKNFDDPFLGDTFFTGRQWKSEFINHYSFNESQISSVGIEYEEERGDSQDATGLYTNTKSVFLQHQVKANQFFATLGARWDEHSQVDGTAFTYRVAPGYRVNDTIFRVSLGSGFKAPGLFQLFDPSFGNAELQPEKVVSWEAGIEEKLFDDRASVGLTYFVSEYSNLISFDSSTFRSINLGETEIRGLESDISAQLDHQWRVHLSHTHLFEFQNNGTTLIRRPRNSWSARLDYKPTSRWTLSSDIRHVGQRQDFDASTFARIAMPGYEVVGLLGEYSWQRGQSAFLRLANLLDKNYEEIDGFGTARFSTFMGLKLEI